MTNERKLIEAAKAIYAHFTNMVPGDQIRIWETPVGFGLNMLIWTNKANKWNRTQRQTKVHDHLRLLSNDIACLVSKITVLTPWEYEEEYFFTKAPFKDPQDG